MKNMKRIISLLLVIVMCVPMFLTADSFAAELGETSPEDWTLSGTCSYDATTGIYTLLPDKTTWSSGAMQFNTPMASDFSISMDYYSGNRSGGELSRNGGGGLAVFYYGKNLALAEYWRPRSGYSVEIDTYIDEGPVVNRINENHVAINTAKSSHVTVAPLVESEDDEWHNLRVTVVSGKCTVYIDGTERISYDTPTTGYGVLGIYCHIGSTWNLHAVKNIVVSDSVEPEKPSKDTLEYYADNLDSSVYDADLVSIMARLSNAAYNEQELKSEYNKLGFTAVGVFDYAGLFNPNACGYAIGLKFTENKDEVICLITARGTNNVSDWVGDFNITTSSFDGLHVGFFNPATRILNSIKTIVGDVSEQENIKYFITGHSRGGAAANLLSVMLMNDGVSAQNVYNYREPFGRFF